MTATPLPRRRPHSRGFSLIELMVGIVVGLVGMLVIYKTVSVWDASTRTTTSGGDAQAAGTLAMFNIEREIKAAGMGFGVATPNIMGCSVSANDTLGKLFDFRMVPVEIVRDPVLPDTLNVLYGNSSFFVDAATFSAPSTANTKYMTRRIGFRKGDVAIVAGPSATDGCQLVQITDNTSPDGHSVTHLGGNYTPDPAYGTAITAAHYNGALAPMLYSVGTMYNLGPGPTLSQWAINTGSVLTRKDLLQGGAAGEVANGVIDMRAEYGVGDKSAGTLTWATVAPADWTTVLAIRVALLVRSSQFEKPSGNPAAGIPTTPVPPTWGAPAKPFVMKNLGGGLDSHAPGDAVPDNWRYYRYRVYEKVIPLRNVLWG
jgi:type IV pilus assembly protein PilW